MVHQAELIEEKVHRGEMLSLHPLSFSGSMRAPAAPMLDPQTNRNAEQYYDPCDPTIGVRNEVFSVAMQAGEGGGCLCDVGAGLRHSDT